MTPGTFGLRPDQRSLARSSDVAVKVLFTDIDGRGCGLARLQPGARFGDNADTFLPGFRLWRGTPDAAEVRHGRATGAR